MSRLKRAITKARTSLFKGAFIHNPLLTQAIGVCPIVAAVTTLRDGIALSIVMGIILLFTESVTSLFLKNVSRWIRIVIYTLMSSLLIVITEPFILPLTSKNGKGLGIWLFLLAVNGLIVVRCERFACKRKLRYCIMDAFSTAVGFAAVAVVVGTVRELITYGTLYSLFGGEPRIPNGALPFIAFIILGFLAAAHKALVIRFYPEEQTDTFSLRGCDEKPVFKDPGLGKKKNAVKKSADKSEDYVNIRPRYESDELADKERQGEDNA